jgi:hypothetical protein
VNAVVQQQTPAKKATKNCKCHVELSSDIGIDYSYGTRQPMGT